MRVNTQVGLLPVGHVFVTPLTRRLGNVAPLTRRFGEECATQEIAGVPVELGSNMPDAVECKVLHPDVVVEVAG